VRVGHRAALPLPETPAPAAPGKAAAGEGFDPGAHTIAEVLAYVSEHPDEIDAIYGAELAGKARVTLLDKLKETPG
jgi:hypothetical protein